MKRRRIKKSEVAQKKSELLEELKNNYALIRISLDKLDIPYSTYSNWYKTDPEFKDSVDEIKELSKELIESKLMEAINGGDLNAIKFYLRCKGGYIETNKVEIEAKEFEIKLN